MMDPNHFLITVLNRFDLVRYLSPEFAASSSPEDVQSRASYANLLEEMLHLIIILICKLSKKKKKKSTFPDLL